jgi:glucose uptake protein GlcU
MGDVSLITGYLSALLACFCFGSFAVPVKSPSIASLNVHPLVFQTYKSLVCLFTAWLSLMPWDGSTWPAPTYTPWGLVSGLFWVPGGVCAIYAVQNAGLAVSQGVWSTGIVMVSFAWGLVIFKESLKSVTLACVGGAMMVAGLWGMSFFSQPEKNPDTDDDNRKMSDPPGDDASSYASSTTGGDGAALLPSSHTSASSAENSAKSRRNRGLLAAVFNGLWGGSIMVPMHYAPSNTHGLGYVISFAIGASTVTLLLWLGLWAKVGRKQLPSMHVKEMFRPGCTAGLLWSIGNIASMLTVESLGEAVGYSICQSSLLVSGLWGIFWFREVRSVQGRGWWLFSAAVTLGGILLLSAQKGGDDDDGGGAGR